MTQPLLAVRNLRVSFGQGKVRNYVVKGLSFTLAPGRCLAIVGESGSGKSVTARSLVGLAGRGAFVQADHLSFDGRNLQDLRDREWRRIRGKDIGFVLQDAMVSLDQLRPIGREIAEGLQLHGEANSRAVLTSRVIGLLEQVGMPDPAIKARQLPHELSGGQRQRALIAAALALNPKLLIADEPTTALDVTVQARILNLLEATRLSGRALILISHNLAVVSRMADEVIVMRHGEAVETGSADQIFREPRHAYTRRLLDAVPSVHSRGQRLASVSEQPLLTPAWSTKIDHATSASGAPLLQADGLVKRFRRPDGSLQTAVRSVSFSLNAGETLGIVGESGSGKSTVARMVMALEIPDEGQVLLGGAPWTALPERQRQPLRRNLAIVYQDPLSSFDPRWTVQRIIDDSVGADEVDRGLRINELLDLVSLSSAVRTHRPLELSGGQRQRVAIARAIASRPKIIVCDEPVSALDVSIQAQILDLLGDLQDRLGSSYLFISHDLGVVHHVSDRVLVMKEGEVVESGDVDEILLRPQSRYAQDLVAALPRLPCMLST